MKRLIALICILVLLSVDAAADDRAVPSWIWNSDVSSDARERTFEKRFDVSRRVTRATLRCATQYASGVISLDGDRLSTSEAYDPLLTLDVTDRIKAGKNLLTVCCREVAGPSAFFLVLDMAFVDGTSDSVISDQTWKSESEVVALDKVSRKLLIPESLRVGIDAVENYEQWKQALGNSDVVDPATFQVTDGFAIRLVRMANEDEDSWVSFAFDPQGRIIVAKEQTGLLRLTLDASGDSVIETETINTTLKECRGLAWIGDKLFANANDSKALFRLQQKRDGTFTDPIELFKTEGGAGHGRNDLCIGPDGMLYSIHGDSVDLPPAGVTDLTSPYRDAREGIKTSEGHLLRIDPESGDRVLLTAGLRNPFGVDFNQDGECFTYDADAEYDMGSPWYRPTRVNHLIVGGDYGWRGVTKSWPPYYCDRADNARPNLDIGKGSPTAVKFGTRSNFPTRYRDALFVLDWAYGRVLAVNMVPRGASYLMAAETFLQGRPLNVTDIDFANDGSMYLVTGGRKTRSAIYRVEFTGKTPAIEGDHSSFHRESDEFSAASRQKRRHLEEGLSDEPTRQRLAEIWELLDDPDPWIQQAAANAIERHPAQSWAQRALDETSTRKTSRAMLSLARSGDTVFHQPIMRKLNTLPLTGEPLSQKLSILQTYEHLLSIDGKVADATTIDRLLSLYPSDSYEVNRLLSQILTSLNVPEATAITINMLRSTSDPVEQLHYLYVLRNTKNGWTFDDRRTYFRGLQSAKHFLGGAGMPDFLAKIREESLSTLRSKEQRSLADLLTEEPANEAIELAPREFVREWTVVNLLESFSPSRELELQRGKEMFAAASCNRCHRLGGDGTLIGPDLTAASGRYTRRDLLTAIIEPSSVIAENYQSIQVLTTDGKSYVGQVALGGDYRSPKLRLATNASRPYETIEIDKTEIESQKASTVSWMPADLLNTLTAGEVDDLLAYIQSGGGSIIQHRTLSAQ